MMVHDVTPAVILAEIRRSSVMEAAEKAAKVVDGWSESKRNYADRVTAPVGGEDASGWTGADKHNPYRRS